MHRRHGSCASSSGISNWSAALGRRDARARVPGEPAEMHLIDDRLGERPTERRIALPVVRVRVDDHVFESRGGTVAGVACSFPTATHGSGNAFPVWVEKYLVRVEAQPPFGIERSDDAIRIDLARSDTGHEHVPVMVGRLVLGSRSITRDGFGASTSSNSNNCTAGVVLGEHAEIGAPRGKRRFEREAFTFVLDGVGRHGVSCP
jgi:hypothetical protein